MSHLYYTMCGFLAPFKKKSSVRKKNVSLCFSTQENQYIFIFLILGTETSDVLIKTIYLSVEL